jgi:hypothetical protein
MLVRQRVMNWEVGLEMVFRVFPALQELRLLHWSSFGLVGETRKVGLPNIRRFYLGSLEYESWYRNGVKEGSQAVDELALSRHASGGALGNSWPGPLCAPS